jgi:hypothetical protein
MIVISSNNKKSFEYDSEEPDPDNYVLEAYHSIQIKDIEEFEHSIKLIMRSASRHYVTNKQASEEIDDLLELNQLYYTINSDPMVDEETKKELSKNILNNKKIRKFLSQKL